MEFPRPRILVSKCLEFAACRYNGQKIPDSFVRSLMPWVDFLPLCPEVESGLGIPRDPIRLIDRAGEKRVFQPASGKDVTPSVNAFLKRWESDLPEVDGFILKNRSPSCGIWSVKIYKEESNHLEGRGKGFFADRVYSLYPGYPVEDEGRLKNFLLREHFLTSIYLMAAFRLALKENRIGALTDFHSRNKLLFLGWNQSRMRKMGSILAAYKKNNLNETQENYRAEFLALLESTPRPGSIINVLLHAFGGFKEQDLSEGEKRFFLNSLEEYRDERIPLSVPSYLILQWAERFDNHYLQEQSFFAPYPKELTQIGDSGKGRDL